MFSFAKKLVDRLEGTAISGESNGVDSYFKTGLSINNRGYALRVLSVIPHSIAHSSGFESWFDYIIRINGHELPMLNPSLSSYGYNIQEDGTLHYGGGITSEQAGLINYELLYQEISTLAKNEHPLTFDVWNAKGGVVRQITVPLNKFEPSTTELDQDIYKMFDNTFAQIGLTLQSQHLSTATYVWRILKSHPGSPAFVSQLVPYSDYIIGCDSAFSEDAQGSGLLSTGGESLLSRVIGSYYNHHHSITQKDDVPVTLFVYNHDYDILRPVTVNLSRSWSANQNRGVLGCDVGYGLLHRIPEVVGKFDNNSISDDLLFENQDHSYSSSEQPPNVPVAASAPPTGPVINPMAGHAPIVPPPRTTAAKKKKHVSAVNSSLGGLNDYMNEELAKSKELDVHYKTNASTDSLPPPPPKAS